MGLLERALIYREKLVENKRPGLLKRAMSYLERKAHDREHGEGFSTEVSAVSDEGRRNKDYYNILLKISTDMSALSLKKNGYMEFTRIITNHYNFNKIALLVFSPDKQKFLPFYIHNFDDETQEKLVVDLTYKDIYKHIVKHNYIYHAKESKEFAELKPLFSDKDFDESEFNLVIPFIFSGHVIGLLVICKQEQGTEIDDELIESLQIIGKLNGALLYNIFQQQNINELKKAKKSGALGKKAKKVKKEIKEVKEREGYSEIANKIASKEKNIGDYFDESMHKLLSYSESIIEKHPDDILNVLHVFFDIDENLAFDPDFDLVNYYSDIQFVVMNTVGTDGFVDILDDMTIYIIMQNQSYQDLLKRADVIKTDLLKMFAEISDQPIPGVHSRIVNYPNDANNYIDLFLKAAKI